MNRLVSKISHSKYWKEPRWKMWKYLTASQVSALCSIICHHIVYEGRRERASEKSVTQLIYFNDNERHHHHQQQKFYFIFLSQPTPKKQRCRWIYLLFFIKIPSELIHKMTANIINIRHDDDDDEWKRGRKKVWKRHEMLFK